MEEKRPYSTLTIDRAAFLLLRVKRAFKKKRMQRKDRERNTQLAAARVDQRASCAGLEEMQRSKRKQPPPLLRSRTLPAIIVPGVSILQAQLGNIKPTKETLQPLATKSSRFSPGRLSTFGRTEDSPPVVEGGRRWSTISKLSVLAGGSSERTTEGSPQLRKSSSHSKTPSPNSSNAFNRFSKLLNSNQTKQRRPAADDSGVVRRLSLESRFPRSTSIDSLVEVVRAESLIVQQQHQQYRHTYTMETLCALVSPGTNRRNKTCENALELPTLTRECDMEIGGGSRSTFAPSGSAKQNNNNLPKPSKKQAKLMQQCDRSAKENVHSYAIFNAIENDRVDLIRPILESVGTDINCCNGDGFTALDLAQLTNNRAVVKLLRTFGAKDNLQYTIPDILGAHLKQLLCDVEMRLHENGRLHETYTGNGKDSHSMANTNSSSSSNSFNMYAKDEPEIFAWKRRSNFLKRLVVGFNAARPPDPPLVSVEITGINSLLVKLQENTSQEAPITAKFIVQWSLRSDFSSITGKLEILDISKPFCHVDVLRGRRYYIRACSGNIVGYGDYAPSIPVSVIPSVWSEVENRADRFDGKEKQIDALIDEMRLERPGNEMLEPSTSQRRGPKKKPNLRQLFTAASKFQKHMRRGIFLASILYHEDKVLVTNEDFLPVIEIDETFPSCINNDFNWLMKIACNWDDTKALRADMDRHSSTTDHFRFKIISAALQMQSSLSLQDLGQLYYKPIRSTQGIVVLSTINYIKSPKSISVMNSRWLPMSKLKNKCTLGSEHGIAEMLLVSLQEQIHYHQVSSLKLSQGLYIAYLKMHSSVDTIQIVVSAKNPNALPHCKVRDNYHVSADEWKCLKNINLEQNTESLNEHQRSFVELIASAAKRLFNYMDIALDEAATHRIYDTEVIDLTDNVSFLVICPSAELSCSVPGQREILLQKGDLISIPLQVFEIIHMNTYNNTILQRFCRLSCVLELDIIIAQHLQREAFSDVEVTSANAKMQKLQEIQSKLTPIWRCVRWLKDAIAFARDKHTNGVLLRHLLQTGNERDSCSPKCSSLELPAKSPKTIPGRGSWPGPGPSYSVQTLTAELSKSEEQLSSDEKKKSLKSFNLIPSADFRSKMIVASHSENALLSVPTFSAASPLISRPSTSGVLLGATSLTPNSELSISPIKDDTGSFSACATQRQRQCHGGSLTTSQSLTCVKSRCSAERIPGEKQPMSRSLAAEGSCKSLTNISQQGCVLGASKSTASGILPENGSGILQVYAAYNTGLAFGTSLKLYVTPTTTAREVVELVVKQLNMTVLLKGKEGPIYSVDMFHDFCLVAIIGARERCLRDDFRPLQLQNPWKKGRLYVRLKHDVLAALEHSSKHSAII